MGLLVFLPRWASALGQGHFEGLQAHVGTRLSSFGAFVRLFALED